MGHAQDDLLDAEVGRALDQQIEHRDHALASLEREALGADELRVQELLEDLRVGELGEDPELLVGPEVEAVAGRLHRLLQPGPRLSILEEGELGADAPGVGLGEALEDLLERGRVRTGHVAAGEESVGSDVREAVALEEELVRLRVLLDAQRVEVGVEMAAYPIGVDQGREPALQLGGDEDVLARRHRAPVALAALDEGEVLRGGRQVEETGRLSAVAAVRARRGRRRGHVLGRGGDAPGGGHLGPLLGVQTVEIATPGFFDGGGVRHPLEELLLDQALVHAEVVSHMSGVLCLHAAAVGARTSEHPSREARPYCERAPGASPRHRPGPAIRRPLGPLSPLPRTESRSHGGHRGKEGKKRLVGVSSNRLASRSRAANTAPPHPEFLLLCVLCGSVALCEAKRHRRQGDAGGMAGVRP